MFFVLYTYIIHIELSPPCKLIADISTDVYTDIIICICPDIMQIFTDIFG